MVPSLNLTVSFAKPTPMVAAARTPLMVWQIIWVIPVNPSLLHIALRWIFARVGGRAIVWSRHSTISFELGYRVQ